MYKKFGKYIFDKCTGLHFQNIEDAGHYLSKLDQDDLVQEFRNSIIRFLTLIHKNEIGGINIIDEMKKEQEQKQFGFNKSTEEQHTPKKFKWS